ncbi:restriction endonuclease subunit S [Algoriphagus resistens]|uniref:restriction endonuclease subunit S n=1 Tax=Algoriphagus resistens TaxID=1750590 RepID=UPI001E619CDB|nr:restriction endonuclease subunit S [Algoriphagus resistens]
MVNQIDLNIDKSNWKLVKFGDVAFEPKEVCKDIQEEKIEHVVGLEHIDSGDIHLRKSATIEEATTFTKRFRKGDVLFGRRRAYLKKAAQAEFDGICSGDITVFRAKKELLPELLPFIVHNEKFFDYAIKHSAGGLSPRVKFKDLANYEFLLPPKSEQARLAELLWAMDEVIEREREVLERLECLLESIENETFTNKRYKKLSSAIVKTLSGGTPDTKEVQFYKDGNIPWLTTKILEGDFIENGEKLISTDAIKLSAAKVLPKGNILAGTRVGVGKFSINLVDMSFSQDVTGLLVNNDVVDVEFLVYQLNSNWFGKMLSPRLRGTTIKGVLKDDLLNMKIHFPTIDEQVIIREKLKQMKASISKTRIKTFNSQSLQKSLINQIF